MKRIFALLAVVFAMSSIMAGAADSSKIDGWISDSMCGAKHLGDNPECVKKCIKGGMSPVFVDEAKKSRLDDRQSRRGQGLLWRSRKRRGDR